VVEEGGLVGRRELVVAEVHVAVVLLDPFGFRFVFAFFFIAFYPFEHSGWFAESFAGHFRDYVFVFFKDRCFFIGLFPFFVGV